MAATVELVVKGTDHASGTLKSIDKAAGGLGKMLKSPLGPIAGIAALGGALGGIAIGASKFIGAASDLEESVNKSKVVFGKFSHEVKDFASTSASSFGISKTAANSYSATLGTILKGAGLAGGATSEMSIGLVKLAADMASFNNIPIDVALEKIRAGLVGESEPLRTVGVLLSEATVKEEAYASGIAKRGAVLTDAQKVQARYNIILSQTKDTQGDFARTSDSLANQTRILGAEWENVQAILGQALLPTVTRLAKALTTFLRDNEDEIQEFAEAFERFAERTLPKVEKGVEAVAVAFGQAAKEAKPLIDAAQAIDRALGEVGEKSEEVKQKTGVDLPNALKDGLVKSLELTKETMLDSTPVLRHYRDALDFKGQVEGVGDALGIFGGKADDATTSTRDLNQASDDGAMGLAGWREKALLMHEAASKFPEELAPAILSIDDLKGSADEARDALFKMFKEPTQEEAAAEASLASYELQLAALHDQLVPLDDAQRTYLDSLALTGREAETAELKERGLTQAGAEQYLSLKDNLIPEQKDHLDLLGKTRDAALKEAEAKHSTLPTQAEFNQRIAEQTATFTGLQGKINEITTLNFPGLAAGWEYQGIMTGRAKQAVEEYSNRLAGLPSDVTTKVNVHFYGTNDLTEAEQRAFSGGAALVPTGRVAGRAMGGSVTAGTPYMVGERGAELFVPRTSGTIVPNASSAGGGDTYVTLHYSPQFGDATPAQAQRLASMVESALQRKRRYR